MLIEPSVLTTPYHVLCNTPTSFVTENINHKCHLRNDTDFLMLIRHTQGGNRAMGHHGGLC